MHRGHSAYSEIDAFFSVISAPILCPLGCYRLLQG